MHTKHVTSIIIFELEVFFSFAAHINMSVPVTTLSMIPYLSATLPTNIILKFFDGYGTVKRNNKPTKITFFAHFQQVSHKSIKLRISFSHVFRCHNYFLFHLGQRKLKSKGRKYITQIIFGQYRSNELERHLVGTTYRLWGPEE